MKTLVSKGVSIGEVYTPEKWANWLIDKGAVYNQWQNGASVCDPTGGEGIFILCLLKRAIKQNGIIDKASLSRLGYVEKSQDSFLRFEQALNSSFGIEIGAVAAFNSDVILNTPDIRFDILIGNPPWSNFGDLPTAYKDTIKDAFVTHNLVPSMRNALLGSSRTDIAALVLNVTLGALLSEGGKALFFLPISLFYGDDAHRGWRKYSSMGRDFSVTSVFEFTTTKVFESIGTSYCAAHFSIDTKIHFPVPIQRESGNSLLRLYARPLRNPSDQWIATDSQEQLEYDINLSVTKRQMPRQGVNTCGANGIFIFCEYPHHLPHEYLYPLVTKETWVDKAPFPHKWILLAYSRETAKPLTWGEICKHEPLKAYLLENRDALMRRKGTLIQSVIKKGIWWSLLGVGPYSFAPFKIIWQAYGKKDFRPMVLASVDEQQWQGNQAMNAFIPCWSKSEAYEIQSKLMNPILETILTALNGGGKCNWAQPGKIKKILSIAEPIYEQQTLF